MAATSLESAVDLNELREMNNKYVIKEVLERYLRGSLLNGIGNVELFDQAVQTLAEAKLKRNEELGDAVSVLTKEVDARLLQLNESGKKKSYIEWTLHLRPN